MKAIGYVRVSTHEQVCGGVSLELQTERLKAYCLMAGVDLAAVIREEGVSGSIPLARRPGGEQLLTALKQHNAAHVVALKLDRLFRDAEDALKQTRAWDRAGVALHLVDMGGQSVNSASAMGRMMLTLMAAFAELERNLISERTSQALQHKRANGERVGTIPFGYQLAPDGIHLEPNPSEQEVLLRMKDLRSLGYSLSEVADELNREGFRTRRKTNWRFQYVSELAAAA